MEIFKPSIESSINICKYGNLNELKYAVFLFKEHIVKLKKEDKITLFNEMYYHKYGKYPLHYNLKIKTFKLNQELVNLYVNTSDENKITPLMMAVKKNDIGLIKFLLHNYASIDDKDKYGKTAFEYTKNKVILAIISNFFSLIFNNNIEYIKYAIEYCPEKIYHKNEWYSGTTLHCACRPKVKYEVLKLLIDYDNNNNDNDNNKFMNVNNQNKNGQTALMLASKSDINKVKYLIQNGANPNLKDQTGNTALIYAMNSRKVEIIRFLLNNGADKNITDDNGMRPFDKPNYINIFPRYKPGDCFEKYITEKGYMYDTEADRDWRLEEKRQILNLLN